MTRRKYVQEEIKKKNQCPPHQWKWHQIYDKNGVLQGEKLVCAVCGPINKDFTDEDRTD